MENFDIRLEQAILSQMLSYPDSFQAYRAVTSMVVADDFTIAEHQYLYGIITKIVKDGAEVSVVNAYTYAVNDGKTINLAKYVIQGKEGDLIVMAVLLHEMGMKRRMADSLSNVIVNMDKADYSTMDAVTDINNAVSEASKSSARQLVGWKDLHEHCVDVMRKKASGEIPLGVATDYNLIDGTGGLEEGSLVIVAGRTSNGKTAFALNLAMNVALKYVPVVLYSLEMTNEQVGNRMMAALTGISASNIKMASLLTEQWAQAEQVGYDIPLYFDDGGMSSKDDLYNSIRNAVDTKQARVVVIDYLQLVKVGIGDMRIEIGKIANELKVLANQLKITIILLSQLSREQSGQQPIPKINQLKESGEIENAADAIYFVYRPEQHSPTLSYPDMGCDWSRFSTHNTALLICAKNRLDRTGEQLLHFDGETMRFWQGGTFEPATHTNQYQAI